MASTERRYAAALFAVATQQDCVDAVLQDLQRLAAAGGAVPDDSHPLLQGLAQVTARRRRGEVLAGLLPEYRALVLRARNEADGVVETPFPLPAAALERLAELSRQWTGKTVHLTQKTDPELLGGIRLRIGNTLYDGSVASALDELQERLLAAPLP
jgi:F-type H+-transporting ATPase subunit delta